MMIIIIIMKIWGVAVVFPFGWEEGGKRTGGDWEGQFKKMMRGR